MSTHKLVLTELRQYVCSVSQIELTIAFPRYGFISDAPTWDYIQLAFTERETSVFFCFAREDSFCGSATEFLREGLVLRSFTRRRARLGSYATCLYGA